MQQLDYKDSRIFYTERGYVAKDFTALKASISIKNVYLFVKVLTLHSSDIRALDVVVELLDLLLQLVQRYKLVLYKFNLVINNWNRTYGENTDQRRG